MSFTLGIKDGDIDFGIYGKPVLVVDQDKSSQDLSEAILSEYDPTRDYGCRATPGNVPAASSKAFLSMELTMAVERLQTLQKSDMASTAAERISSITALKVTQSQNDPTTLHYNIATATETGSTVTSADVIKTRRMSFGHLS
jgi:hypothetical protein